MLQREGGERGTEEWQEKESRKGERGEKMKQLNYTNNKYIMYPDTDRLQTHSRPGLGIDRDQATEQEGC